MTSQLPHFRCLFLSCQQQKNSENWAAVTLLMSFLFRDNFSCNKPWSVMGLFSLLNDYYEVSPIGLLAFKTPQLTSIYQARACLSSSPPALLLALQSLLTVVVREHQGKPFWSYFEGNYAVLCSSISRALLLLYRNEKGYTTDMACAGSLFYIKALYRKSPDNTDFGESKIPC